MRWITKVMSVFFLFFMLSGVAHALLYTDVQDLSGVYLGEGPVGEWLFADSHTYQHATPADFEVPWDTVNSATLEIAAYWVDGNNDQVAVNGRAVGYLNEGGSYNWSWREWAWQENPSLTELDISSTFATWEAGNPLEITITADGGWGDFKLELASSTFALDYDNGTAPAPVPEPATMLLLGSGLLGLAGVRRRRQ